MTRYTVSKLRPAWRWFALACFLALLGRPAQAFPIFARKYETSCQTCHTVFPKLNPFGQAFRLNGYRMPKETEEMIKARQLPMGAEAYKRLWPMAVWPNEIPGSAPLAVNIKAEVVNQTQVDPSTGQKSVTNNDFQFPQEVNLFAAGTLGEHLSAMAELTHAENADGSSGVEIEHARLDFDSFVGPEHLFNLRIGKFAPNLYDGFQEMWISTDNGIDTLFTYNPVGLHGGNSLGDDSVANASLPARVRGIELYGVAQHRFFYTLGVATHLGPGGQTLTPGNSTTPASTSSNGNFGNNASKDFYWRFDYKFGGMGLDGDTEGVIMPPENWRENSFRVGVLGLTGNGKNIWTPMVDDAGGNILMVDSRYNRAGLFASWMWGDLNIFGADIVGTDRLQTWDPSGTTLQNQTSYTYNAGFVMADYVFTPAFHSSLRLERLKVGDASVRPFRFVNASLTYLVAVNLKTMVEWRRDLNQSQNQSLNAVLRLAF